MALWITVLISAMFVHHNVRDVSAEKISLAQLAAMTKSSNEEKYKKQQRLIQDEVATKIDANSEGLWPFDDLSTCSIATTRDQGTDFWIHKAARNAVKNSADCGMTMFMNTGRREAQYDERNRKRRRVPQTYSGKAESFLERLERRMKNAKHRAKDGKKKSRHNTRTVKNRASEMPEEMDARIVGGTESIEGRFPWVVTIGKKSEGLNCGGTLINNRWVLTAAHCFQESEALCDYNIRVGSFNWLVDESGHHMDIDPELVVRHKDFSLQTMENDIAMVKLSKPVPLSPNSYINNICLPEVPTTPGTECVAAGWGVEHENDKTVPSTLREVTLTIVDQCSFDVNNKEFCASSDKCCRDTCQGDSGGPLMTKRGEKWYLVGVTSFGYGCGRPDWPGVYTDVYSQRDFIWSVLNRY